MKYKAMKYFSNPGGDLSVILPTMAAEICSIALGRTVHGAQLGDRHNVYHVGGNEMEFITNIIPIYTNKQFTQKDITALLAAINTTIKKLSFVDYRDPIGLFNSTDNLLMTSESINLTVTVLNKPDGVFNNCTSRICVYIADIIYLNSATITNYGPTCIVYDTESILAFPNGHHSINIPKLSDFTVGRQVIQKITKFSARLGLYAAIEDIYYHEEKQSGAYNYTYDYLQYQPCTVKFTSLNYLQYDSSQTLREKINARLFNSGVKLTLEDFHNKRAHAPKTISGSQIIHRHEPLTCFISGAPIYEHCYALDVYAWTEIYYIKPDELTDQMTYEPHLSPSCPAAEAEFKAAAWSDKSDLFISSQIIRFKRNDEYIYLYTSYKRNPIIAVSVLVPLHTPVHIVVSPTYNFISYMLAIYGIHAIMYRTWYPRLARDVINCAPISKEEKEILHLLNGPVVMKPEATYGYYYVADGTEFRSTIQARHLKNKIQYYTPDVQGPKIPNITDMWPDIRDEQREAI